MCALNQVHERLGKGVAELERLLKEEGEGSFDFAFIGEQDIKCYAFLLELNGAGYYHLNLNDCTTTSICRLCKSSL